MNRSGGSWLRPLIHVLAVIVLIAGLQVIAVAAAAGAPGPQPTASGGADHDDDGEGEGGDDGEDDEEDEDEDKKKDKKDKDKDEREPEPVQVVVLEPSVDFRVTVGCHVEVDRGRSVCVFAGVAAQTGEQIGGIAVPVDAVCATVVEGDSAGEGPITADSGTETSTGATQLAWYAPGAGFRGPAFASRDGTGVLTLVLEGAVTTVGEATYWLRAAAGVVAAIGPGLRCEPLAAETAVTPAAGTGATGGGTIVVQAFVCEPEAAAADPRTLDWYAACPRPAANARFEVTLFDGATGEPHVLTTDADGTGRVTGLAPGRYRLDQLDANWCFAESDNVDEQGAVVVEDGVPATVWIFNCPADGAPTTTPK